MCVGCAIWLIYQYIWFAHCAVGAIVLILTTLFAIFFWTAALVRLCDVDIFRENANIFVASLAVTYITYLCWSALASNPDAECNPFVDSGPNTTWQLIAGTTFTTLTILSIATASVGATEKGEVPSLGNNIIAEDEDGDAAPENEEMAEAGIFPVTIPTMVFQAVMIVASIYYAMLFTNWGNMTIEGETESLFGDSKAPMWIKVCSQWATIALFTISISLKICCPDRII